ncbi:hypothetical protein POM88_049610 [Heracleum sosnowskyi]|uniref:Glycosyl transferase 48 domain-containing protein n=1 Tax=Heracleum sosnowskyi TaxID=360622 RepID=A0AAD8GY64_9APIA|nr:hypothetical protein POM88_049610 [Heracleum sosnowskyi]
MYDHRIPIKRSLCREIFAEFGNLNLDMVVMALQVLVVTSTFPIDHSCHYHEGSFAHFKGLVDSVTYVSKMLMRVMNGINAPKVVECLALLTMVCKIVPSHNFCLGEAGGDMVITYCCWCECFGIDSGVWTLRIWFLSSGSVWRATNEDLALMRTCVIIICVLQEKKTITGGRYVGVNDWEIPVRRILRVSYKYANPWKLGTVVLLLQDITCDIMVNEICELVEFKHSKKDSGRQLFDKTYALEDFVFPPVVTAQWELGRTVKESAVVVPTNLKARRRVTFFTNSLFVTIPCAHRVRKMLSFSVMTPYYSEETVYSKSVLEMENEDVRCMMYYRRDLKFQAFHDMAKESGNVNNLLAYLNIWKKELTRGVQKWIAKHVICPFFNNGLYWTMTVKESAVDVPINLEARRRVTLFTNSLFMKMQFPGRNHISGHCNIMTPYYSEETVYSKSDLEMENEDASPWGFLGRPHTVQNKPSMTWRRRVRYRQQRTRLDPGLPFHYFFHDERTASASVEVVEGPLSQRESFCTYLQEIRFGSVLQVYTSSLPNCLKKWVAQKLAKELRVSSLLWFLLKKMAIDHPYNTVFQLLALENGDRIKGVITLLLHMDKKYGAEDLLNELSSYHEAVIRQMKKMLNCTSNLQN